MINKIVGSVDEAVKDIKDGSVIMISGFGEAGSPVELIHALIDQGAKDLTIISNNTGSGHVGLASLIEHKRVKKNDLLFSSHSQFNCFSGALLERRN
jgi:3-oxoadipate CoA-transferase alpha subunit